MREHERFERLSGAIALGEATPSERDVFDAHAATCAECRDDARDGFGVISAVAAARDEETWRPSLDNVVAGRIRDARARRSTLTLGALGWAVAASIVLNVAFASGFTGRLASAFRDTGEPSGGVVSRLTLETNGPSRAVPAVVHPARAVVADVRRAPANRASRASVVRAHAARAAITAAPERAAAGDASVPDVPDVLAGLDVDRPRSGARTVAIEPPDPACDPAVRPLPERPCPPSFSGNR